MNRLVLVLATLALGACASQPPATQTAQQPRDEKEYRTGSRIPVRDPGASASPTSTLDASAIGQGNPPARTN